MGEGGTDVARGQRSSVIAGPGTSRGARPVEKRFTIMNGSIVMPRRRDEGGDEGKGCRKRVQRVGWVWIALSCVEPQGPKQEGVQHRKGGQCVTVRINPSKCLRLKGVKGRPSFGVSWNPNVAKGNPGK